ncbi:Pentatricopeptide repeat-containing protein [Acorus calamus]|uniref:Pentatricopeptide repeat-containing protein n=1 Tax=Acorus calamus TaxID=4465 RepID=A0AAV9FCD4_ACOCL|nr:Pentatricopeptide repeat-containing protein [Acorus calamus]
MASLPSISVTATLNKLEPDLKKLFPASIGFDKSIPHQELRCPEPQEALSVLGECTTIETATYVPLLQECIDRRSVSNARALHAHAVKTGADRDPFLSTFLINVYAKCASMARARALFDELPHRNIVAWTSMITGYAHNSQPDLAVSVFVELLDSGVYPTNYTLGAALSACSSLHSLELGKQIHGFVIKYRVESDTSMGNSLCALYSKCGDLESAVKAFQRIPDKNVISWTTVITACGNNGDAETALKLFVTMLWTDCAPNEFTLTSVLSSCCVVQALGLGEQVHSMCVKLGCDSSLPMQNSIMYLYMKCGKIGEARRIFDEMGTTVRLITWNAMIAGLAQMMDNASDEFLARQSGTEALKIFLELNRSGTKPDLFSFSSVLSICSRLVILEQGEQIHAQTIKTGFLSDIVVGSALVNMYNKCGSIENACKAFVEMPTRTMISWTSMITGYSQHGRSREALQLFEEMRLAGVRPNQITFVGVLSACSHAGMLDEAKAYFKMMKNEYGIKPVMDHYACMVDIFVRLGRLGEAFDFMEGMEFEPNEVIWSILVAGCRSHGNMELGFRAAEKLLELKPKDAETYVLLLNMYISAGRWQEVSKVRKLMKEERLGGLKDRSWINVKDRVFAFRADDHSHPQGPDMYALLENLLEKARGLGYVARGELEVAEEEEKAKMFGVSVHHSERLAIAFGLLNTPDCAPVRVVKNMSVCRDCHDCVKFVSILTRREIIIKDSKRLHRFRDGRCSCGDFGAF